MYTEENERKDMNLKDFLLKLLLIIIFVLLLLWLFPRQTTPTVDLTPLTNQIFGNNIERMKNAAIPYYTTERLPKAIGDKDTLTLREMIAKNLLIPLTDKNGKACDVDASYVSMTKMEDEYLLKVYLKCSEEEDYILVHIGCYNYCEGDVCAKKDEEIVYKPSTPTPKPDPTPTPTPNPEPEPEPEPDKVYKYQYMKYFGATFSKWTNCGKDDWVVYVDADNIKETTCDDKDTTCLEKIKVKEEFEQVGYYNKKYVVSRTSQVKVGEYQEVYCAEYAYEKINNIVYSYSGGSWVKTGTITVTNPPADTPNTSYVLVGGDYSECADTCESLPKFIYDVYTYTGTVTKVDSAVNVSCAKKETKIIPIYTTKTIYDTVIRKEKAFANVKYYCKQTRKITSSDRIDYKWSHYNDTNLLNQYYSYTGRKCLVQGSQCIE